MKYTGLLFLIITTLIFTTVYSQKTTAYNNYKLKFPNESVVQINRENVINIDIKNNEIQISDRDYSKYIYLNQSAKFHSKQKIYISDFFSLDKVSASSFNRIKGKYKESKVNTFKWKDETHGSSFYDDIKSLNFLYSGLTTGSKSDLGYTKTIKNPRFLGAYYVGDYFPIENFKLKIVVNKNIAMEFKTMYMDSVEINFKKSKKGSNNIYEWDLSNIQSYPDNNNSRGFKFIIPQIIPIINYYHVNNDTTFILNSTRDLFNWYTSLTSNLNQEPCDNDLKLLVDSITSACTTEREKVKEIYYWAQQNIKYIAFEDGLGGFIPRDANEVFQKKYGDCKDNSSILKQMLKVAGIDGHLTWIGTRSIPYKYEEIYSPLVDNHMILTYFENDKPYFLDATGRYQGLDIPTSFIQGKEALIAIDSENFKILEVPIVESEKNFITDSTKIHLEDDVIKGQGTIKYQGYDKINIFYDLERLRSDDNYKDYFKNRLEIGSNNFLLDQIDEKNKYDYDKEYQLDYSFTLKNYLNKVGENIYINLNLNQKDIESIQNTPPFETEIDYTHRYTGSYNFKLKLPENYEVDYLPKNYAVENELCDIKIAYRIEDDHIDYYHSIKTKYITLSIQDQLDMDKIFREIQRNYKEVVVLKAKSNETK